MIKEGQWDCDTCGKVGNLGRNNRCESCNKSRPENVLFYLPTDAPEVTDPKQLEKAKAGPDWICHHCDSTNSGLEESCTGCDAPKTDTLQPTSDKVKEGVVSSGVNRMTERITRRMTVYAIVACVGIALLSCLLVAFFKTYEVQVTLKDKEWHRAIEIEEYKTLQKSGWDYPADARVLSSYKKHHHDRRVIDHYETRTKQVQYQSGSRRVPSGSRNLGNGYFETTYRNEPIYSTRTETYQVPVYRSEPVYQTYYEYEVDRWVVVKTVKAAELNTEPYWPRVVVSGEKERKGKQYATYTLHLKNKEKIWEHKINYDDWSSYKLGSKYTILVNYFGVMRGMKTRPWSYGRTQYNRHYRRSL